MNDRTEFVELTGDALGTEGIGQLAERAEEVCLWEQMRIQLANEPLLMRKRAEYAVALDTERTLRTRLAGVTPLADGKSRRRRIAISWIVATVLILSGFVLSLLTLEPYRLGMKAVIYCIGIAVVVPYLTEKTLELFGSETLKKVMVAVACLTGLASLILLATIRGNLLGQQVRQGESASAVIEGEEPQDDLPKNTFYEDTVPLLQLVMALLAFSMEIGAGIAVHEAERMSGTPDGEYESVQRALQERHDRLAMLVEEIVTLQNEAAAFAARFWRDFYWSLLKGTLKKAAKWFILPVLVVALGLPLSVSAQTPIDLVVAVDLTESVAHAGPDGRTEFAKNIAAVTRLLASVPAGARVTIIAITGNSFGEPYILLRAQIAADPGYFGEKLASGKREILRAWKKRSVKLEPRFKQTDILGALMLASVLFAEQPDASRKVLVIYSDMQQARPELSLPFHRAGVSSAVLAKVQKMGLLRDMRGTEVYVLDAQSTSQRLTDWRDLREFWQAYFKWAGAWLREYTSVCDSAVFEPK